MPNSEPKDEVFSELEENALESASLEADSLQTLTSDLQRFLNKNHRKQMEKIEEKISEIEERCCQEVRKTIKKYIRRQLKKNLQDVTESCETKVSEMFSSLLSQVEGDARRLNNEVDRTNILCQEIQKKYTFKWCKPWFVLVFSTALTGAFMGMGLFLMQTSPLAVFLMNKETRKIYDLGMSYAETRDELLKLYDAIQKEKKDLDNAKKKSSH